VVLDRAWADENGRTSSEVVANLVAPARVVKAGNTFAAALLGSDPNHAGGQRRDLPVR
jgi:predicted dinucleotide-binding enzyme